MYSERTRLRLQDIVDNIDWIAEYLDGMPPERFAGDRRTMDAVERCLQRITEAILHIGEAEMADLAPDLPFAGVRGLGNRLRHEYHRIDPAQIYATACDELPPLRAAAARVLGL